MNGKTTLREYLAQFQLSPMRSNMWDAIFVISIVSCVYFLWKGPLSLALTNVAVTAGVWWIKQLEKELSSRNGGPR